MRYIAIPEPFSSCYWAVQEDKPNPPRRIVRWGLEHHALANVIAESYTREGCVLAPKKEATCNLMVTKSSL